MVTLAAAFFKKFGKSISESEIHQLLQGNKTWPGYGSVALLGIAINHIKVNEPEKINSPIGLLIAFWKNPGQYLDDKDLRAWNKSIEVVHNRETY